MSGFYVVAVVTLDFSLSIVVFSLNLKYYI